MTNEQLFEDLKQYINGRLSQTEVRLDGIDDRLDCIDDRLNGIDGRLDQLGTDMRDGFAGVGEALETRSDDVDRRLTTLETKAV